METVKGKYKKRIRCNFEIEAQATNSCFLYQLIDDRCQKNTMWKPPSASDITPCMWIMRKYKLRYYKELTG